MLRESISKIEQWFIKRIGNFDTGKMNERWITATCNYISDLFQILGKIELWKDIYTLYGDYTLGKDIYIAERWLDDHLIGKKV